MSNDTDVDIFCGGMVEKEIEVEIDIPYIEEYEEDFTDMVPVTVDKETVFETKVTPIKKTRPAFKKKKVPKKIMVPAEPKVVPMSAERISQRDTEAAEYATEQEAVTRVQARVEAYPDLTDQLGQLFDDIKAGHFGAGAENSQWFKAIDGIKKDKPINEGDTEIYKKRKNKR